LNRCRENRQRLRIAPALVKQESEKMQRVKTAGVAVKGCSVMQFRVFERATAMRLVGLAQQEIDVAVGLDNSHGSIALH
jgi:hypothetical protein